MPELPEVETVARDLDRYLRDQVISDIKKVGSHDRILQTPLPTIRKRLRGQKVRRVFRRAKLVVIETTDYVVIIHLKMTGQLMYVRHKPLVVGGHPIVSTGITVPNQYTRFTIHFKQGGILYFNDLRKFGWIKVMSHKEFKALAAGLGLEPLNSAFTLSIFETIVGQRRAPIKAVLLEQKKLVGLGNIYVDEVLFAARIRPDRIAASLTKAELRKLWQAIPRLLRLAIKQRGTTFSNFRDPGGLKGNFVSFLKVYGRGKDKCLVCGRPLRKTRVAGRGTHWCAHCQR